MVNKKISGQTIAIIILAVILLITIAFGGVYAFYSAKSNKATGKIVMANLNIDLYADNDGPTSSGKSEIVISNGTNVVPGQELKNSPLMISNRSNSDIYLIVVYEVNAVKLDEHGNKLANGDVVDPKVKPVIDIGAPYINPINNINYNGTNQDWVDYVFTYEHQDQTRSVYRCLVSTKSHNKYNEDYQTVEVIGENKLKLHHLMGDDYQQTSISFTFQAYAIGANSFSFETNIAPADRCNQIVSAIYESVEYKFLDATINT